MIRVGHIDFINTIPLDLEDTSCLNYNKIKGVPTVINKMLLNGEVDVGVISISFYLEHRDDLLRIGELGIVSDGPAMSILLFSNIDISKSLGNKVLKVYETPKSATSVLLNRIILKKFYGIYIVPESVITEADAVLLIGDDALLEKQKGRWSYVYDLGNEWKRFTGLPAVFAVLATNKKVFKEKWEELENYLKLLRKNYEKSMRNLDITVAKAKRKTNLDEEVLYKYFQSLKYELGKKEEESIALFEKLISEVSIYSSINGLI